MGVYERWTGHRTDWVRLQEMLACTKIRIAPGLVGYMGISLLNLWHPLVYVSGPSFW